MRKYNNFKDINEIWIYSFIILKQKLISHNIKTNNIVTEKCLKEKWKKFIPEHLENYTNFMPFRLREVFDDRGIKWIDD